MEPVIVSSLIALAGTVISGIFSAVISGSLTKYRIEQLEKKVDKHNNLIERMYKMEEEVEVIRTELKHIENDLK